VSFNYDIKNAYFLQRRFLATTTRSAAGSRSSTRPSTSAATNYGSVYRPTVQQDRRFSISISLAGIGSFSPPFGGMSPTQVYR